MNELFHFATVRNCQNAICIWGRSNKNFVHLDFDLLTLLYSYLNLETRAEGHSVPMYNLFSV